ncbi:MAG: glycosyltransferase family 2 protein [Burkholderiaceae bacterium]
MAPVAIAGPVGHGAAPPLDHDDLNRALSQIDADAFVIVPDDALLPRHALVIVAEALQHFPDAGFLYGDEAGLDERGQLRDASLLCDWNAEWCRAHNYLGGMLVVRRALAAQAGPIPRGRIGAAWWSWVLRLGELAGAQGVVHVPHLLCHRGPGWRGPRQTPLPPADTDALAAVQSHLDRSALAATALASPMGGVHVQFHVPSPAPRVSLIIPTRNGLSLLRQCVQSILERTRYENYEIFIVDNGSDEAATLEYLRALKAHPRIRVHRDDRPFNFSALNNAASERCSGDLLGLVNNDIEVLEGNWLDEMVGHAARPEIGAVGARLWYPDGRLQHAGVVLGIGGVAGHYNRLLTRDDPGYQGRAHVTQEFSAVTAACLLLRRDVFERVGRLDEAHLSVDYNDIDLCLRIRQAGYRIVWTPHAQLVHHESASRGRQRPPEQQARYEREFAYMVRTWGDRLRFDPSYNPNLALTNDYSQLADRPRVDLMRRWFDDQPAPWPYR